MAAAQTPGQSRGAGTVAADAERLARLRSAVLEANLKLPRHGLVQLTWGNASAIDRELELVAIKPSGVDYAQLRAQDIVVTDLQGNIVAGEARPSTDTATHLALYRAWPQIGGVVHTHSSWATAWAQAQREIPLLGTTHADLCARPIPLTRALTAAEVDAGYELATGQALIELLGDSDPAQLPCALVRQHGPFCWGASVEAAVTVAVTLEEVARLASLTATLQPRSLELDPALRRKHYERKHGPDAYYGQP